MGPIETTQRADLDELSVLLVNIPGDLISDRGSHRPEWGPGEYDHIVPHVKFAEALSFLKTEIELWSAETGIRLELETKLERVEYRLDTSGGSHSPR